MSCLAHFHRILFPAIHGWVVGAVLCLVPLLGAPAAYANEPMHESSAEDALPPNATLADYQRVALHRSPDVAAAYDRWQAAVEGVPQARSLPDPRLTFAGYIEEVETRVGPQQARVGFAQTLPWFGVLRTRGEKAHAQANAAAAALEAERLALHTRVTTAYADYYYLGRATVIAEANLDLLTQLEDVARRRYEVNEATYSDVVKAQVEIGTLSDRVRTLHGQRASMASMLNAALNLQDGTPLPWPHTLPALVPVDDEYLRQEVRQRNPELRAMDATVIADSHDEELARLQRFPTVTVGVDWIQTGSALGPTPDSGKDPVVAMISFNVPIWRESYRAAERQAAAKRRATTNRRLARRNSLVAAMDGALFRYNDARRAQSLYRDTLIPKAEQSLQAAQTAYTAAEGDFLALIDAQRTLLAFALAFEDASANGTKALAQLTELTGGPIGAITEGGTGDDS